MTKSLLFYKQKKKVIHQSFRYTQSYNKNNKMNQELDFTIASGSERHPSYLKGKEIGLWYAKRSKGKGKLAKKAKELRERPLVALDSDGQKRVKDLLDYIHDVENEETNAIIPNHIKEENELFLPEKIHNPDPVLDQTLLEEFKQKKKNPYYNRMYYFRQKLPTFTKKTEIINLIKNNQVVVITGETGCGKTTQIPQYILDDYIENSKASMCSVICTQPRRISAISTAERVAQERAEACGHQSVGYLIRLEKKIPRTRGSILYCTTGILLKWLESDRLLSKATHVILDEVHERDILSDFLIIILRDLLTVRPDLKIILMSATLNSQMFSQYFDNCPMLFIPGFMFPVREVFLEDILTFKNFQITPRKKKKFLNYTAKEHNYEMYCRSLKGRYPEYVIEYLLNEDESNEVDVRLVTLLIRLICETQKDGAILVFLTGWAMISQVHSLLCDQTYFNSGRHLIIPLHSLMPTASQGEVFDRPPPGVRKIILSTNIAETSITIDDVVYVIDCGKVKLNNFDTKLNLLTLKDEWVSKANAKQRKGRAGRVQEGICYHLYTKHQASLLLDYQLPEMLRTRLENICLQIKILNLGEIVPFLSKALEPPSADALNLSISFLQTLNALDDEERLTPLGYHLARLPVDPQTGKMILFGAIFSCLDPVTTVAASLGFKDAFVFPLGKEKQASKRRIELAQESKSDHIMLVNAFRKWERAKALGQEKDYCWNNFLSRNTLKLLSDMKKQFGMLLKELNFIKDADPKHYASNINSDNIKLIKAIICAGLYPNVAKLRNPHTKKSFRPSPAKVLTSETERAVIHPKSVNCHEGRFESPWLVFHQKMKSSEVYIHDSTMVSPFSLLFFGGKLSMKTEDNRAVIQIDDWIKFWSCESQEELIKELRSKLDKLLETKINCPGPSQWNGSSKETKLLEAVIHFLTSEEILVSPVNSNDPE